MTLTSLDYAANLNAGNHFYAEAAPGLHRLVQPAQRIVISYGYRGKTNFPGQLN